MINLAARSRQLLVGVALALSSASVFAATYNISLFQAPTGTGSGSFTFTNTGTVGCTSTALVALSTNASSTAGAQTFNQGNLNVCIAAVSFSDNKTPPNTITGNYVEGLTGTLSTTAVTGLTSTGQCQQQLCFYRITFSFTANSNPNSASKTYLMERVRQSNNNVDASFSGTYAVANTATVPEPGSLVLVVLGLIALGWHQLHRRRRFAV